MDERTSGGAAPPPVRPTDRARLLLRRAELLLGLLALLVATTVGLLADLTEHPDGSHLTGIVAGFATVLVCWTLLGLGVAWWHRRLAEIDEEGESSGWAGVEPRQGSDH